MCIVCVARCQAGTVPGVLEAFQRSNETLEKIQKNLEDYLETKRMAFPRFYFLSNDELLEILAQTKNVQVGGRAGGGKGDWWGPSSMHALGDACNVRAVAVTFIL